MLRITNESMHILVCLEVYSIGITNESMHILVKISFKPKVYNKTFVLYRILADSVICLQKKCHFSATFVGFRHKHY